MPTRMRILWMALGVATLVGGCRIPFISVDPVAVAQLKDANGKTVGRAVFVQDDGSVSVIVDITELPPGQKGVHVHTVGRCEPPTFESAGEHLNPTGAQHGSANPRGPHTGDLPNISIDSAGRGHLEFTLRRVSVEAGSRSLFDADGSSVVIHADPDDLRTDPDGKSGARIACGVIRRGN